MQKERQIRASYDQNSIVVYQAYSSQIADPAVRHQRFVSPFSFQRMTWIKPSFLWLMHRSKWGQKSNQQRTLAVHISREGWDKALSMAVLTHPEPSIYRDPDQWKAEFDEATVHIQWDTERSLRGTGLNHFSVQVGISRHLIHEFVNEWIVKIEDVSPTVAKIREFLRKGRTKHAQQQLPRERIYEVHSTLAKRIHIG